MDGRRIARLALLLAAGSALSACSGGRSRGGPLALLSTRTASAAWSVASGPRVTVRSDVDPEELAEITGEIEQMIDTLEGVGFEFAEKPADPVGIVIFTREADYELGTGGRKNAGHYRHFYQPGMELPATTFMRGEWDNRRRAIVRHELAHRYVHFYYPNAPVWLNEGLACYFERLELDDGRITLGLSPFGMSGGRTMMPSFERLFAMTHSDFTVIESAERNEYDQSWTVHGNYRASWTAVHFLMTAGGDWRARFDAYLDALAAGLVHQTAWDRAFAGVAVADLEKAALAAHSYKRIPSLRTTFEPPPPPPVQAREMRDAEVDVLRAWYRDWDGPAAVARSTREIERAIAAEPRYADAHLWRGHLHREADRFDDARASYAEARRLDPESAPVLIAELDLALEDVRTGRRPDSRDTVDAAIAALRPRAHTALGFDTLARALRSRGQLDDALGFAKRATEADLGCASCWSSRGEINWALGRTDAALSCLEMGYQQSNTDEGRAYFRSRRLELVAKAEARRAKDAITAPAPVSAP